MKKNQRKKIKENKKTTWEKDNLSKALEIADKLKMYRPRNGIPGIHSQVSDIADKLMKFTTKNLKQSAVISIFKFNKRACPSG